MSMMDGIQIKNIHSYRDLGLHIAARNIGLPEKKSIRETVPFMNGYYDFTALNGAPAWGEREIEYTFDVTGDTPQEAESNVEKVLDWLCNVHDEDIFDDTLTGKHWHGSYKECSPAYDDSGDLIELTVIFVVYPFKIANSPTTYSYTDAGTYRVRIENKGMAVAPYVSCNGTVAIQIGSYVTSVPDTSGTQLEIDLERGWNTVVIANEGAMKFYYYEEVL